MGFTAAVFATYFLLGLGLLGAIKAFSVCRGIAGLRGGQSDTAVGRMELVFVNRFVNKAPPKTFPEANSQANSHRNATIEKART